MAETEIRCLHCGHTEDEHYHSWADCNHADCICMMFEPMEIEIDDAFYLTKIGNDV